MANPFFIQPVDVSQPLASLGQVLGQVQDRKKKELRLAEFQEAFKGASTPQDYVGLATAFPEYSQAANLGLTAHAQQLGLEKTKMNDLYKRLYASNDPMSVYEDFLEQNPDTKLTEAMLEDMGMAGGNPETFKRNIGVMWASSDPTGFEAAQKALEGGDSSIAAIQEMKWLTEGMPSDDIKKARRIKLGLDPRASTTAETAAAVEFAKKTANLQAQLGLGPRVAAATVAAQNEAKVLGDEAQTEKSNTKAWSVYDSAMSNLAKSMGNTSTGAFVGFLPSITANQQIAEGAIAVMAPVLKDMFRSAGEGTFTDADQKMLIQMIPTRKDSPKARIEKIKMIDQVVRAKLGTGETSQPVSASSGQVVPTQQQEEALLFLKANPTHPKAELIRQKLMTQGVL